MDACTARPVWLTVSVPDDAPAGVYRSCVEVTGDGVKSLKLPFELRVQERRLPRPAEWSYHLDLWQHPAAAARVMGLALWSDAHFDALRPLVPGCSPTPDRRSSRRRSTRTRGTTSASTPMRT